MSDVEILRKMETKSSLFESKRQLKFLRHDEKRGLRKFDRTYCEGARGRGKYRVTYVKKEAWVKMDGKTS